VNNSFRLDAGSYATGANDDLMAALMNHSTTTLGKIARVFDFGPFKRTYIDSYEYGVPMLTSAEMMELSPTPSIMAKADSPKWKQYQVERGWLLVSCSGTIGNVAIVPQYWDGWAVSQDAIRVLPKHDIRGLVWAFLSLPTLKSILVSRKSGSVIDHIYEKDIATLEMPNIPDVVKEKLNKIFDRVLETREASWRLHEDTINELFKVNSLPLMSANASVDAEIIIITSDAVTQDGADRLNAHFYNPTAQLAINNIRKCPNEIKSVGKVSKVLFTGGRIKRNYVESIHGVPFLSGKNIIQVRPTDVKYLSNLQMADLDELLLKGSYILVTRSGTVGRTCFVWRNYEDYAASEHILRVIPDESEIDPGYLYAFLSSVYGYQQILRYRHGSVIDEITDKQVEQVLVPCPSEKEQTIIGNKIRESYEKRAEAIRLEDEAQTILTKELAETLVIKEV
jgi:type I restriction enzyme S subunit